MRAVRVVRVVGRGLSQRQRVSVQTPVHALFFKAVAHEFVHLVLLERQTRQVYFVGREHEVRVRVRQPHRSSFYSFFWVRAQRLLARELVR